MRLGNGGASHHGNSSRLARVSTLSYRLVRPPLKGQADGWVNGQVGGWTNGCNRPIGEQTNGWVGTWVAPFYELFEGLCL